ERQKAALLADVEASAWEGIETRPDVLARVMSGGWERDWNRLPDSEKVDRLPHLTSSSVWCRVSDVAYASVVSYEEVDWLACSSFFDGYLAPNGLGALVRLNQQVSGCWLNQEEAILVRRPKVLARD